MRVMLPSVAGIRAVFFTAANYFYQPLKPLKTFGHCIAQIDQNHRAICRVARTVQCTFACSVGLRWLQSKRHILH